MTHPITPPPELIREWCEQLFGCPDEPEINAYELAHLAAQYGADQELEACVDWISKQDWTWTSAQLRAARRPKPPSLKERALQALEMFTPFIESADKREEADTIRHALEQLDD